MSARAARGAGLAFALALAGCAAAPIAAPEAPALREIPLRNARFELQGPTNQCPPGWGCSVHATPPAFRFQLDPSARPDGGRALCAHRVSPELWAMAVQYVRIPATLKGATLRFSVDLLVEGRHGRGAGPMALLTGIAGQRLSSFEKLVDSTDGWQRVSLEFPVHEWTHAVEVGLWLDGGPKACIDDARLEVVAEAKKT